MPKKIRKNATWSPYCQICQYMRTHKDFQLAIKNSTYFNVNGIESVSQVIKRYKLDKQMPMNSFYNHLKNHQKNDRAKYYEQVKAEEHRDMLEKREVDKKAGTVSIGGVFVDELGEDYRSEHQLGLDEFISAGRAKLNKKEMSITAATYLQAIKIKAEIDSKGKDRKLDVFKTIFKGASPAELANATTEPSTSGQEDRPGVFTGQYPGA